MSGEETIGGEPGMADNADADRDVRPVVAGSGRSYAVPLFIAGLAIMAVLLFSALDSRRRALSAPATVPSVAELAEVGTSVPPLFIPPDQAIEPPVAVIPVERIRAAIPNFPAPPPVAAPSAPPPQSFPVGNTDPVFERPSAPGQVLVFDRSAANGGEGQSSQAAIASQNPLQAQQANRRVRAGRLSNPSTTVVQGTVIPAVLETAIDTNRGGPARAIVSLNVRGFDGSRVLIPRGSRLIGQYSSGLVAGQNRVLVEWNRLIRPDGATIMLDSPSADRLGRAGIRGDVNSHFWERFASAIFRTTLDVGSVVAAQEISSGSLILLPRSLREGGSQGGSQQIQRTLSVDQGAAVSVFVSRDLDFTPVETGR